jgi:hypothetical protein
MGHRVRPSTFFTHGHRVPVGTFPAWQARNAVFAASDAMEHVLRDMTLLPMEQAAHIRKLLLPY